MRNHKGMKKKKNNPAHRTSQQEWQNIFLNQRLD